ncbi:MAG: MoxR family ATPase [SAR324 cluster bacterium]|nr:MoxR family ATPase [SAR324 cluster bacterium]
MLNNNQGDKADELREKFELLNMELSKVIVGQKATIRDLFSCILCGGNALIEGVPGLGKTLLVKSFSQVLDLEYSRIQFTPDLMPIDVLGTNLVNEDDQGNRTFKFYQGPIFGQIILADEINRATPKTQSALLEAMQENKVTIFGNEYQLKQPFVVLATQNPIEMEGTYPLPEAQVDRFFYKLLVEFPSTSELRAILEKTTEDYQPELKKILDGPSILRMRSLIKQVPIASHVRNYAINLMMATHPGHENSKEMVKNYIRYGSSPRGLQTLVLAAKLNALLEGRYHVAIDDIRTVAKPALRHRIILSLKGLSESIGIDDVITNILESMPVGD